MTDRWCPTCRSEWWIDVERCPDCGDALVADRPPDLADDRDHTLVEFDLGPLEPAERWQLELLLGQHHVVSQWRGTALVMSAAHRHLVDEFLADRPSGEAGASGFPTAVDADDGRPLAGTERIASLGRRLAGYAIDLLFLTAVLTPISVTWTRSFQRGGVLVTRPTPAAGWVMYALALLYEIVAVSVFERTVGQLAMRMRVVRGDGSRVGWLRAVVRAVVGSGAIGSTVAVVAAPPGAARAWVSLAGTVVVFGPMFVDPLRRGLHDLAAGTVVTQLPRR